MENIQDMLILLYMANQDAIDYGKGNKTKIINSNMIAIGADNWSIKNTPGKLSIDFTLYHHRYRQEYRYEN